jgi:putative cardiolipin synthase
MSERFPELVDAIKWTDVRFISDLPGKNDSLISLQGGGRTTTELAEMLKQVQHDVVIQTPYLVLTKEAEMLFRKLTARGVRIRVSTNSMASTDNAQAFSGYLNQKKRLLEMGMEIFEYKPKPAVATHLIQRYPEIAANSPVFAIHAKTMVIDSATVFVGTFNLDPRSVNLNTEVGVIINHPQVAREVEGVIEEDMSTANSWNAATDDPDQYASFVKRSKVFFWRLMPIQPLL